MNSSDKADLKQGGMFNINLNKLYMLFRKLKNLPKFCLKDTHSVLTKYFPTCQTATLGHSLISIHISRTRNQDVPQYLLLCLVFMWCVSTERNKNRPFSPYNNLIYASQTKYLYLYSIKLKQTCQVYYITFTIYTWFRQCKVILGMLITRLLVKHEWCQWCPASAPFHIECLHFHSYD